MNSRLEVVRLDLVEHVAEQVGAQFSQRQRWQIRPQTQRHGIERQVGGEGAQLSIGVSDKVTRVFQGLLLFFVLSCDTLILYKVRLVFDRARNTASKGA